MSIGDDDDEDVYRDSPVFSGSANISIEGVTPVSSGDAGLDGRVLPAGTNLRKITPICPTSGQPIGAFMERELRSRRVATTPRLAIRSPAPSRRRARTSGRQCEHSSNNGDNKNEREREREREREKEREREIGRGYIIS